MARLTGRQGTLSVSAATIADLFDWTCEWEVEWVAAPIKGEVFNTGAIGGFTGRVTARRFVNNANPANITHISLAGIVVSTSAAGANIASGVSTGEGPGSEVTYVLNVVSGGGVNVDTITGTGIVRRGTLNAPRDLANDSFELEMTSIPVVT